MSHPPPVAGPAAESSSLTWWQRALPWFGVALLVGPLTILPHELGHYLTYSFFGFPDMELRPASISYGQYDLFWGHIQAGNFAAAAEVYPLWQVAVGAAAGPLVTAVIVLACCYLAYRRGPTPWIVAPGLMAPIRSLIGIFYLIMALFWGPGQPHFDEFSVAQLTGVPVAVPILLSAAVLFRGWYVLLRLLPRGGRLLPVLSVLAGMAVGLPLYNILGSWLLSGA
jgi:hypothetical protein